MINNYELTSGLVDAAVYLVPALMGVVLWFVGWKRRPRGGSSFLMGLGVVLVLGFGLASIGPVSEAVSAATSRQESVPSTTSITTTSTTLPPTTTTTTTTTKALLYATSDEMAMSAWAVDAVEYAESRNWGADDQEALVSSTTEWARFICGRLSSQERSPRGLDDEILAQIEAQARDTFKMERWEAYGAVWYDSLVNGLCVDRPLIFGS